MEKKIMSGYSCYCTEAQTKKALELGAPIRREVDLFSPNIEKLPTFRDAKDNDIVVFIPTAEKMISWLEEQKGINNIVVAKPAKWVFLIYDDACYHSSGEGFSSRKEATLAAIDAALEYLSNNKK